jgi:hypothetical protein
MGVLCVYNTKRVVAHNGCLNYRITNSMAPWYGTLLYFEIGRALARIWGRTHKGSSMGIAAATGCGGKMVQKGMR